VTDSLTSGTAASEKHAVLTSGSLESELIKSQALTTSLHNASTGSVGETKSTHTHLGYLKHTLIVGYRANKNGNLVLTTLHELSKLGEREGGAVDVALEQPLKHSLVEFGVSPPGKEAVKLHEKAEVRVLRTGFVPPVNLLTATLFKIDTLTNELQLNKKRKVH